MTARSVILTIPAVLLMGWGAFIGIVGITGLFRVSDPVYVAGPTINAFLFYIVMIWLYQWLSRGFHGKLLNRFSVGVLLCVCIPLVTALIAKCAGDGG
jgi:hypothetical protein